MAVTFLRLPLPGLSPVLGKTIVAKFDGGLLSSDGGILVLREVEQRLRVADPSRSDRVRLPDFILPGLSAESAPIFQQLEERQCHHQPRGARARPRAIGYQLQNLMETKQMIEGKDRYLTGLFHATELPDTAVTLPSTKRTIEVLTMLRREQPWTGPEPVSFRSVPNKPAFQFNGYPAWAEFILLRLLEGDGWKGAWVKNFGGRAFWRDPLEITELPSAASALFRQIEKRTAGRGGGCWDIIVSRGDDVLFIESKQRGRDKLRLTQQTWIENALDEGVPLSSFVIVEWLREDMP